MIGNKCKLNCAGSQKTESGSQKHEAGKRLESVFGLRTSDFQPIINKI